MPPIGITSIARWRVELATFDLEPGEEKEERASIGASRRA